MYALSPAFGLYQIPPGKMGDFVQGPPSVAQRPVRVLVTGYGPFHAKFPVNSSWSVASSLPKSIPARPGCPQIDITVPPKAIDVSYHTVVEWTTRNLAECEYDIILHIGLAAGREFFTLERQSQRAPFWENRDINGLVFSKAETEALWPAHQFPQILKPTFDCDDVWRRWRSNVVDPDLDLRPSDDPGNYLCGFIYYCSTAWFWRQQCPERPVVFLHVPDLPSPEEVAGGVQVAVGLIQALVESREKKGICDPINRIAMGNVVVDQTVGAPEIPVAPQMPLQMPLAPLDAVTNEMAWTYQR